MKRPEVARAAVLRKFGEPLAVEEVRVPESLEPGALLVKIELCSICGTDVHLAHGNLAIKVNLPVILGHEMVGRIIEFGPGSEVDSMGQKLQLGDRVLWSHAYCGQCFHCTVARQPFLCSNKRMYMYESMERAPYLMGGFAEFGYVLPRSGRVRVPDDVPDELASLSSCAFRSVVNAFEQIGGVGPNDTVVIQGSGPLGILATGMARVMGAKRLITLGAPAARLELAQAFGADHVIAVDGAGGHEARLARVRELTDGRGADIVLEFSGHPDAFAQGLDMVRNGGRYMLAGQTSKATTSFAPSAITLKNVHVQGSLSADISHYHKALEFISRHQKTLPFGRMITNRYHLGTVNQALDQMALGAEIKPIVQPWAA
jgi:D-arabinose 1-dehydrogenase-like Zn-dependent alcohol dehydrogenase